MDSHFPYWPPHQPPVFSFDHQHNKGHVPHYAQAGQRQVAIIKPSQRQPAPRPDLSMANPDRAGHGWHQRFQLSLRNTSSLQPRGYYLQQDNTPLINEGFKSLRQNPHQAISIAEGILAQGDNLSLPDTQKANLIKVRALFQLGRFDDCQKIFETLAQGQTRLNNGLRMAKGRLLQATFRLTEALPIFQDLYHHSTNEKEIKVNGLALGRQYQYMGQPQEALTIFKTLRTDRSGHEGTPCNDREIEMALGRQYQYMGQHQEALTIFKKLRTDRSGHEGTPCNDKDIELTLGRQYQYMGQPQEALTIFKKLRTDRSGHEGTPCNDKDIELTLGRQYQDMGQHQEALTIFKKLCSDRSGHEGTPCNDKDIELTLGRQYQYMGQHQEALTIFKTLRADRSGHEGTPCNDKDIELSLGRQYQDMGQHQEALAIFKQLRTDRSGHEGTPCNDKDIELTLGRQYQYMGQHQEALTIFKKLRTDRSGHEGTPCNDKEVELALGRQYQYMGQHQEALTIFKKLHTDRSGYEGTPCNDKEVELALGRQYQDMGQPQEALTIFKTLRTDRSGHEGTPCNDKEVELALGDIYVDLMNWLKFDQMQLDDKGFAGPEVDLCISIRYFKECISSCQDKDISGLLTKAINHACDAIEKSQHLDASSFSQLGHSVRIAASLPIGKVPDTFPKNELKKLSSIFFTEANKLAPNRQDRLKNEAWRNRERDFLARLSSG